MKIEINLPDPKHCNGCPCCTNLCGVGGYKCVVNNFMHLEYLTRYKKVVFINGVPMIKRPQICKDKNGY